MRTITIEWLKKQGACKGALRLFKEQLGEEASIEDVLAFTRKNKEPNWEGWLLGQNPELTNILLENGANIHANDDFALRYAAECGCLELVKLLLENGANIHADNNYALRHAVSHADFKLVKFLVKEGADTHIYNIHLAIQYRQRKIAVFLIMAILVQPIRRIFQILLSRKNRKANFLFFQLDLCIGFGRIVMKKGL